MFCQKCGSILVPKKENNKKVLACSRCSWKSTDVKQAKIQETVEAKKEIEVIDEGELQTLPLTDAKCDKCDHEKAFYWTVQTRAADEPETKFLKCEKCSHTWRDYD